MKKLVSGVVFLMVLVASIGVVSADFSDVDQGDFYYDSVKYLEDEGIVNGNPDGTFGYLFPINRAELLTIVIRAKFKDGGEEVVEAYADATCFTDSVGKWYTQYVCYAKAQGWVGGYPDGTFMPEESINFVEALKMVMQALEIEYGGDDDPWYKGMVESAGEKNLIPLTITSFGQMITRGEMCDLIARALKYNDDALDEWLGDKAEYVVTYESLLAGESKYDEYLGMTDVYCDSEADCPDPIGMSCVDHVCWSGDPCAQCPEGTNCVYDGSSGSPSLTCVEDDTPDVGPLFIDWSFENGSDHSASMNVEGNIDYENDLFSLEFDPVAPYWYADWTVDDFSTDVAGPEDEEYMFDTFNEEEGCTGTSYEEFHELILETDFFASLELGVFDDIDLEGDLFSWDMTVFATRNPIGWDLAQAQGFMSCSGTTMVPVAIVDNYLYDGEDTGAIIWVDECPEKGLEPEMAGFCADLRADVVSQLE